MKYVFQLIDKNNGTRTPAAAMTKEEFAVALKSFIEKDENFDPDGHYVIPLLASQDVEPPDWQFSQVPVMLVSTFIITFGEPQPCQNNSSNNQA